VRGQSRKSSDASSLAGSDAVIDAVVDDDDDDDDGVARKAVLTASHVRPAVDGDDDNKNGSGSGLKSLRRRLSFEMSFELWIQPD